MDDVDAVIDRLKDRLDREVERVQAEIRVLVDLVTILRPYMEAHPDSTVGEAAEALGYDLIERGRRLYLVRRQ